ncbi:hypothetical protein N9464_03150 [Flavobacteriaceae bacterium]|nr:hypothetical protein [Flavobacteriaceae bacterium]
MKLLGIFRIGFVVNFLLIVFPATTSIILIRQFDLIQVENYNFILAILTSSCAVIFSSFVQGNISNLISGNIKFSTIFLCNSGLFLLMNLFIVFLTIFFDLLEPDYWIVILGYLFLVSITKIILNLCINIRPKTGLLYDLLNSIIPLISVLISDSIINFILTTIVLKLIFNFFLIIQFELYKSVSKNHNKEFKLIFINGLGYLSDSVINIGANTIEKLVLRNINNFSFTISNFVNKATGPITSIIANNNFWVVLFSRKKEKESLRIIYNYNLIILCSISIIIIIYKIFELEILNILLYIFNQKFNLLDLKDPIFFTLIGLSYSAIFNVYKKLFTALRDFKIMRKLSFTRTVLLFVLLFVLYYFEMDWTYVFLFWSLISFVLVVIISFVYDKKFIWLLFLSFLFNLFVYLFGINKFLAPIFLLVMLFILYKTFLKFNSFKW